MTKKIVLLSLLISILQFRNNCGLPCEKLKAPRFGFVSSKTRNDKDTASYSCREGYFLRGPQHRECGSDGKWTDTAPMCLPYSSCGHADFEGNSILPQPKLKVVRGRVVPHGAWPWQTMLTYNEDNDVYQSLNALLGGGTIINNEWILTGGHLFDGFPANDPGKWVRRIFIVVGITRVPYANETLPTEMKVYRPKDVIRHKNYNKVFYDYDVSLIRIGARMLPTDAGVFRMVGYSDTGSLRFNKYVRPICLPCINDQQNLSEDVSPSIVKFLKYNNKQQCETRNNKNINVPTFVIGFGDTTPKGVSANSLSKSRELRQGAMRILPRETCRKGVEKIRTFFAKARFTDRMLCAQSKDEKTLTDACIGDSGGPLLQRVLSSSGHYYWIQTGIVSWGWGCANTDKKGNVYPGFYTDVTTIVQWIWEQVENYDFETNIVVYVYDKRSETVFKFTHRNDSSIEHVKQGIENLLGYPITDQRLYLGSRRLSGLKTLQDYHFRSGRVLSLLRRRTSRRSG